MKTKKSVTEKKNTPKKVCSYDHANTEYEKGVGGRKIQFPLFFSILVGKIVFFNGIITKRRFDTLSGSGETLFYILCVERIHG